MQRFTSFPQRQPQKRSASSRKQDFFEIYQKQGPVEQENWAIEQSSRCSQCGIPFCQSHCPLTNNIPDWLRLAAEHRYAEAYELSSATNNFPEITGKICPQDRLCEGGCVIENSGHGSVTIGSIEEAITERAFLEGWVQPVKPARELAQSVGIIGAGPAGLAAAEELRKLGYQVTIYDRYDRPGGLLVYGIPEFKLEKSKVERRCKVIAQSGVTFALNQEVGKNISLAQLEKDHDAILFACGVYQARQLGFGLAEQLAQPALPFLTAANRLQLGDPLSQADLALLDLEGKKVAVIGGGDTAMDCLRTSVRLGAKTVDCLYRRDRANMPGSQREVTNAQEEGVNFRWLTAPTALAAGKAGSKESLALTVQTMQLLANKKGDRLSPEPIPGEERVEGYDLVITALGFSPEPFTERFGQPLPLKANGTFLTQANGQLGDSKFYAAGDAERGASLVVWAIVDGRKVAQSIHQNLKQQNQSNPTAQAA